MDLMRKHFLVWVSSLESQLCHPVLDKKPALTLTAPQANYPGKVTKNTGISVKISGHKFTVTAFLEV